jgi:homoserine kinase
MLPVMAAARAAGALGCVLSGAGPSLLAVVTGNADAVARGMEKALAEAGLGGRSSVLDVDAAGATVRVF